MAKMTRKMGMGKSMSEDDEMDDEERYYIAHADPTISNYTRDVLACA